jgi:hypothetical protein
MDTYNHGSQWKTLDSVIGFYTYQSNYEGPFQFSSYLNNSFVSNFLLKTSYIGKILLVHGLQKFTLLFIPFLWFVFQCLHCVINRSDIITCIPTYLNFKNSTHNPILPFHFCSKFLEILSLFDTYISILLKLTHINSFFLPAQQLFQMSAVSLCSPQIIENISILQSTWSFGSKVTNFSIFFPWYWYFSCISYLIQWNSESQVCWEFLWHLLIPRDKELSLKLIKGNNYGSTVRTLGRCFEDILKPENWSF